MIFGSALFVLELSTYNGEDEDDEDDEDDDSTRMHPSGNLWFLAKLDGGEKEQTTLVVDHRSVSSTSLGDIRGRDARVKNEKKVGFDFW